MGCRRITVAVQPHILRQTVPPFVRAMVLGTVGVAAARGHLDLCRDIACDLVPRFGRERHPVAVQQLVQGGVNAQGADVMSMSTPALKSGSGGAVGCRGLPARATCATFGVRFPARPGAAHPRRGRTKCLGPDEVPSLCEYIWRQHVAQPLAAPDHDISVILAMSLLVFARFESSLSRRLMSGACRTVARETTRSPHLIDT